MRKEKQLTDIVSSMKSLKLHSRKEYDKKLSLYVGMSKGGTGGIFRNSESTIRQLHFSEWLDSDFYRILVDLGEAPVLSEEEYRERFSHENKGIVEKIFSIFR